MIDWVYLKDLAIIKHLEEIKLYGPCIVQEKNSVAQMHILMHIVLYFQLRANGHSTE